MKSVSLHGILFWTILCVLLLCTTSNAQTLNKPEAADNPNLAGNSAWTAACASADFNEYYVNFTWNPPLVEDDNEFILELSDADGYFDNPVELSRVGDKNASFDFDFVFSLPTDTRGENYRFRVRSTNPELTSPESDAFAMYFIGYNDPILISRDGSGDIPSGGVIDLCYGETVTLQTHNVTNPENYEYSWYRNGTLLSERSNSIEVTEEGVYYIEIDYGVSCSGSANTLSNPIELIEKAQLNASLSTSGTTDLCAGETVDLLAAPNDANFWYTWYKDGVEVATRTQGQSTYTVDASITGFTGSYSVKIESEDACTEQTDPVVVTNKGDFEVTLDDDVDQVLLPGQTIIISATTTASTPVYQWYRDGVSISGETNNTLSIGDIGEYFLRVTESGGSCASSPIDSETVTVVLPDSFEFEIDYASAYADCQNTEVTLLLETILAVAGDGTTTEVTSSILGDFNYQWYKDGAVLDGETDSQIVLSDPQENGAYYLSGALDTFEPESNELSIVLLSDEVIEISSTGSSICDSENLIALSASIDLASEAYTWTKDGLAFASDNENPSITEAGVYRLSVQRSGCSLLSNEITINVFDESVIGITSTQDFVITEGGTETITASGADSYEWYDENNNLISTADSVTLDTVGSYLLIASVGNCQVTESFEITLRETFQVPNVITANGDGINDLWVLPNTYSKRENIRILIFNEKGEQIVNQTNYQNNWPESATSFTKQNMVFYYKIQEGSNTLKQGTITVIK